MHIKIIKYIKDHGPISYDALNRRAIERGYDLSEFDYAIERVHKDKRIKVTSELLYTYQEPQVEAVSSHTTWLNEHYPRYEYEMPFPEIDYGFMFLKTKEERDEYKALASGRPLYMIQSKREYSRRKDTA